MLYYSTNRVSPTVDFKEATINGQAPDKGLYFPEKIPTLSTDLIKNLKSASKDAIAFEVMRPYVGDEIPADDLAEIASSAVSFDFPLVALDDDIYTLELFHGPT
ncbi:MAG: threonine synthase, partial [Chitinophagaceae bacterium]